MKHEKKNIRFYFIRYRFYFISRFSVFILTLFKVLVILLCDVTVSIRFSYVYFYYCIYMLYNYVFGIIRLSVLALIWYIKIN